MNHEIVNRRAICAIVVALALIFAACHSTQTTTDATGSSNAPRIAFLHVRMTDSTVTLLDKSIQPGTLKQKRSQEDGDGMYYEFVSSQGSSLWKEKIDDPLVRRVEYEDPEHPGQLKSKLIRSGQAELTVRIPYADGENYLEFYRIDSSSGTSTRTSIGRIRLSL